LHLAPDDAQTDESKRATHTNIHRTAVSAARAAVIAMRSNDEIGDDAFHRIEEEFDWLEMAESREES
jgi:CPA1 family monovalent cation:H+ antiporter